MSPPDVWGPPIWRFFHILAENIHEEQYHSLIPQLFTLIRRTCVYLPCPECSEHATKFLAKISPSDISNKTEFKNMLYLFHNMVNKKKGKPLFDYSKIRYYSGSLKSNYSETFGPSNIYVEFDFGQDTISSQVYVNGDKLEKTLNKI